MTPVDLRALVREIPDFPENGILFKDITPLLLDAAALEAAVSDLAAFARISVEYLLEYGVDVLEVHADAFAGGARVLVHDDLLATGGTARGVCDLVAGLGAEVVGCAFLIELSFLGGRERLAPYPVHAVLDYSS